MILVAGVNINLSSIIILTKIIGHNLYDWMMILYMIRERKSGRFIEKFIHPRHLQLDKIRNPKELIKISQSHAR